MAHESPEVIEQQMNDTRDSLTQKVAALETQVTGTLQNASDAVQETVETVRAAVQDTVFNVKDTVQEGVMSMKEGVRDTLDFTHHVRKNPWGMVGGAVALGLVTGLVVFRSKRESGSVTRATHQPPLGMSAYSSPAVPVAAPSAPQRPGWLDDLLEQAGQEIKRLGQEVITSASQSLRSNLEESIPQLVQKVVPTMSASDDSDEPYAEDRNEGPFPRHNGRHSYRS